MRDADFVMQASEWVFSDAGRLYDERRSRLLPENAEKILFLMNNLKVK